MGKVIKFEKRRKLKFIKEIPEGDRVVSIGGSKERYKTWDFPGSVKASLRYKFK